MLRIIYPCYSSFAYINFLLHWTMSWSSRRSRDVHQFHERSDLQCSQMVRQKVRKAMLQRMCLAIQIAVGIGQMSRWDGPGGFRRVPEGPGLTCERAQTWRRSVLHGKPRLRRPESHSFASQDGRKDGRRHEARRVFDCDGLATLRFNVSSCPRAPVVPAQKVVGPSKSTPNSSLEGTWIGMRRGLTCLFFIFVWGDEDGIVS